MRAKRIPAQPNGATAPIIDRIESIAREVHGWSPVDQLYTLFNLACFSREVPGDIVEIGSWCGRSAAVLGLAARRTGGTRVHSIDLFPEKDDWFQNSDGTYSFQVVLEGVAHAGHQDQTVWKEPFETEIAPVYAGNPSILAIFTDTITRYGLQDLVIPHRGDSSGFAREMGPDFRCRLAFIDGTHSYEGVRRDIRNVERFLSPGGWICFDDAFSSYEGVNRAIVDCILDSPRYEFRQQMTRKFFVARKKRP